VAVWPELSDCRRFSHSGGAVRRVGLDVSVDSSDSRAVGAVVLDGRAALGGPAVDVLHDAHHPGAAVCSWWALSATYRRSGAICLASEVRSRAR
jgi:hypothetical protein